MNQKYYYKSILNFGVEEFQEAKNGLHTFIEHMIPNKKNQDGIHQFIPTFNQHRGTFSKQALVHAREVDRQSKKFQNCIVQAFIILVTKLL